MGKRELVLIVIFVTLGIVVYQVTAPPPPPGSEGFSLSGVIQNIKRGVQGARETATVDSAQALPVDADVRQIRVNIPRNGELTITGSDRADVSVKMTVSARGFDQAEAKGVADAAKLTLTREGDAVVVSTNLMLPQTRGRRTGFVDEITITVAIPQRLGVWIAPRPGRLVATNVARAEVMGARSDTRISGVRDQLTITHTGGGLDIDGIGALKLSARNSRGTIRHVRGTASIDTVGGELTMSDIAGPLEIESRNSEIRVDTIKGLKPPLRVNSTGGRLRIEGLATEARIDGRNTEIDVTMLAAAPVTIYSTGEDLNVTAPPTPYTLDAVTTDGRISIDDGSIKPSGEGDQRAAGAVRGGGPGLTLRVTHGGLNIRRAAGK
jgi:putative adhesin